MLDHSFPRNYAIIHKSNDLGDGVVMVVRSLGRGLRKGLGVVQSLFLIDVSGFGTNPSN